MLYSVIVRVRDSGCPPSPAPAEGPLSQDVQGPGQQGPPRVLLQPAAGRPGVPPARHHLGRGEPPGAHPLHIPKAWNLSDHLRDDYLKR